MLPPRTPPNAIITSAHTADDGTPRETETEREQEKREKEMHVLDMVSSEHRNQEEKGK